MGSRWAGRMCSGTLHSSWDLITGSDCYFHSPGTPLKDWGQRKVGDRKLLGLLLPVPTIPLKHGLPFPHCRRPLLQNGKETRGVDDFRKAFKPQKRPWKALLETFTLSIFGNQTQADTELGCPCVQCYQTPAVSMGSGRTCSILGQEQSWPCLVYQSLVFLLLPEVTPAHCPLRNTQSTNDSSLLVRDNCPGHPGKSCSLQISVVNAQTFPPQRSMNSQQTWQAERTGLEFNFHGMSNVGNMKLKFSGGSFLENKI